MTQLYGLPPERPQVGRLKTPTSRASNSGEKKIVAADQVVWVIPIEAPNKNLFSEEINWNQDADQSCASQITTIATWIHHHTRHGTASTIIN